MKVVRVGEIVNAELILSEADLRVFQEHAAEVELTEADDLPQVGGQKVYIAKGISLATLWVLAYRTGCREVSDNFLTRKMP